MTCDTLLSSQGTHAHQTSAFRPQPGATFQTYIRNTVRSNPPESSDTSTNNQSPTGTGLAWRTQCGLVSVPPLREPKHYAHPRPNTKSTRPPTPAKPRKALQRIMKFVSLSRSRASSLRSWGCAGSHDAPPQEHCATASGDPWMPRAFPLVMNASSDAELPIGNLRRGCRHNR